MAKKILWATNDIWQYYNKFEDMEEDYDEMCDVNEIENDGDEEKVYGYAQERTDEDFELQLSNIKDKTHRVIVKGDFKTWDRTSDVYDVFDNLEQAIRRCVPSSYEASCRWFIEDGYLVYEEASHDAPMGGTKMYFYIINGRGERYLTAHVDYPSSEVECLFGKQGLTRKVRKEDLGL